MILRFPQVLGRQGFQGRAVGVSGLGRAAGTHGQEPWARNQGPETNDRGAGTRDQGPGGVVTAGVARQQGGFGFGRSQVLGSGVRGRRVWVDEMALQGLAGRWSTTRPVGRRPAASTPGVGWSAVWGFQVSHCSFVLLSHHGVDPSNSLGE